MVPIRDLTIVEARHAVGFGSQHRSVAGRAAPDDGCHIYDDTLIGIHDTNFDGQDIVVGKCTLTVDGPHAFASLHILAGGALTHSFSTNGLLNDLLTVTGERHVLSATNPPVLAQPDVIAGTIVVTDLSGSTNYHLGTDYLVLSNGNATRIGLAAGSSIPDGATISVSYQAFIALVPTGLNLVITNGVQVEAGGAINADGRGYGGGLGTGAGTSRAVSSPYVVISGGGGGYGGLGGASSGLAGGGMGYGSITTPTNNGSGGGLGAGPGGPGGGTIRLSIGGQLQMDGQITANGADGANPRSGGGSGGSIWVSAASYSGAGSILANGGAGEPRDGGGGGGGRIAAYAGAAQPASGPFTGTLSARGGPGASYGGAGTIYTQGPSHPTGLVQVDNGGPKGTTPLSTGSGGFELTIVGGAVVALSFAGGPPLGLNNVLIGTNGWLSGVSAGLNPGLVAVAVLGNMTIEAGGGIVTDGQGYGAGAGSGVGGSHLSTTNGSGGGGGHGGFGGTGVGGAAGGGVYGSVSIPEEPGSSGGSGRLGLHGGAGGGAVVLTVNGLLALDGTVSANGTAGTNPGDGGGAGGSVWLTVGSLSGAGVVAANGGPGQLPFGGGGGGGRVAVYYGTNSFAGSLSAHGGQGAAGGGAGTIYTKDKAAVAARLLVDNGGLPAPTITPLSPVPAPFDLAIVGGAKADPSAISTSPMSSLEIGSNSWLTVTHNQLFQANALTLTVSSNATIQAGGGIVLDGLGYPAGQGTGAGHSQGDNFLYGQVGTGGGYGGVGGASAYGQAGGSSYDSYSKPQQPGSGGGNGGGFTPSNSGGVGGGALQMRVGGRLGLDGIISADGASGTAQGSGGGSGGSINLTVGSLSGRGLISANGGSGDLPYGGGGGGGRITVFSSAETSAFANFTGSMRLEAVPEHPTAAQGPSSSNQAVPCLDG